MISPERVLNGEMILSAHTSTRKSAFYEKNMRAKRIGPIPQEITGKATDLSVTCSVSTAMTLSLNALLPKGRCTCKNTDNAPLEFITNSGTETGHF